MGSSWIEEATSGMDFVPVFAMWVVLGALLCIVPNHFRDSGIFLWIYKVTEEFVCLFKTVVLLFCQVLSHQILYTVEQMGDCHRICLGFYHGA